MHRTCTRTTPIWIRLFTTNCLFHFETKLKGRCFIAVVEILYISTRVLSPIYVCLGWTGIIGKHPQSVHVNLYNTIIVSSSLFLFFFFFEFLNSKYYAGNFFLLFFVGLQYSYVSLYSCEHHLIIVIISSKVTAANYKYLLDRLVLIYKHSLTNIFHK